MRRPLCAVCLVFAAAVALLQTAQPAPPDYREAEGASVTVTGRVAAREIRQSSYYGEQTVLYLKDISNVEFTAAYDEYYFQAASSYDNNFQIKTEQTETGQIKTEQIKTEQIKTKQTEGVICRLAAGADSGTATSTEQLPSDQAKGYETDPNSQYVAKIGSEVTVAGTLHAFERAKVPGGYDEAAYYQIEGYSFSLQKAEVLQASDEYSRLDEALFSFRGRMSACLQAVLNEQDAAVMRAMLLGEKQALPSELKKLYQEASISHILVISGLHITFLGMGLHRLLKYTPLPREAAAAFCVFCMYLYGRMTGMGTSAARAVCMFALMLAASALGRSYDLLTALALSASLILLKQPFYIRHSGFLLSFGAVLGLALISPALRGAENKTAHLNRGRQQEKLSEKLWKKMGTKHHDKPDNGLRERFLKTLRDGLAGGAAVFLATLPISIQSFYEVCPYSLLFNLFVIPLSALLLPAGLMIPALYTVCPPLALPAGRLCHLILKIYEQGSRLSVSLPGSRLRIGHVEPVRIAFYYLFLTAAVIWGYRASRSGQLSGAFSCRSFYQKLPVPEKLSRLLQLMLFTVAVRLITLQVPYDGLQITMLDVGQGDCFLVQAGKTKLLVDGGSSSETQAGTYRILPALKYYGIQELDYIFISHLDEDHINGIRELLQNREIRCGAFCLPDASVQSGSREWEEEQAKEQALLKAAGLKPDKTMRFGLQVQKTPRILRLAEKDKITGRGWSIEVLHPQAGMEAPDENSTSLVLLLQGEDIAVLFSGDLPGEREALFTGYLREMRQSGGWSNLILKAGHHGSNGSTMKELLEAGNPVLTLISCGKNNSYGHPGREMTERVRESGSYIVNTAENGTCEIFIKKGEVRIG